MIKIAFSQIRTDDLLITSEVPYQLGHKGIVDFPGMIRTVDFMLAVRFSTAPCPAWPRKHLCALFHDNYTLFITLAIDRKQYGTRTGVITSKT